MKILFIGGRFRSSLEKQLKEKGYEIKIASTKNSVEKNLKEKYDLYIVDSFDPGTFEPERDGIIEAIRRIFEMERNSKVIVYADNSNLRDAVRFIEYKIPFENKRKSIEEIIEKYSKQD